MQSIKHAFLRLLPWVSIALFTIIISVIAFFPAQWAIPLIIDKNQNYINLIDAEGTIWKGSATLVLTTGSKEKYAVAMPDRMNWQTNFWPLLTGTLRVNLTMASLSNKVTLIADFNEAMLTSGTLKVPAALLLGLGSPFNTLNLQGDIQLAWTSLRFLKNHLYGQINIDLNEITTRLSPFSALGNYHAQINAKGSEFDLSINTLKGPFILEGKGEMTAHLCYFNGTASVSSDVSNLVKFNLNALLALLGRRKNDTGYDIIFNCA